MTDLALYFAYGSNMDGEQMLARCPSARFFARAWLPNHELAFRGSSAAWGGGVATVVPRGGDQVPGVVYVMKRRDLRLLDGFEGHPFVYQREQRLVRDSKNAWWRVHTYTMLEGDLNPPSRRYMRRINEAYAKYGFARLSDAVGSIPGISTTGGPIPLTGHRVFVYGTLRRGQPNHQLLEKSEYIGSLKTPPKYTMLDLGAFPGVIEGGTTAIHGEVFEVDELTLRRLDMLEGHPSFYCRTRIEVGGVGTWIYLLPGARGRAYGHGTRPPVRSGDWRLRGSR